MSYTNTISTHSKYDFNIRPYHSRFEVTEKLKQATCLCRNARIWNDFILPGGIGIGVISTCAAGVFSGSPYFMAAAGFTAAFAYLGFNKLCTYIEDIESLGEYYTNLGSFKFSLTPEIISRVYNEALGYDRFILEQVKT
jgi:hypothetical protein